MSAIECEYKIEQDLYVIHSLVILKEKSHLIFVDCKKNSLTSIILVSPISWNRRRMAHPLMYTYIYINARTHPYTYNFGDITLLELTFHLQYNQKQAESSNPHCHSLAHARNNHITTKSISHCDGLFSICLKYCCWGPYIWKKYANDYGMKCGNTTLGATLL